MGLWINQYNWLSNLSLLWLAERFLSNLQNSIPLQVCTSLWVGTSWSAKHMYHWKYSGLVKATSLLGRKWTQKMSLRLYWSKQNKFYAMHFHNKSLFANSLPSSPDIMVICMAKQAGWSHYVIIHNSHVKLLSCPWMPPCHPPPFSFWERDDKATSPVIVSLWAACPLSPSLHIAFIPDVTQIRQVAPCYVLS